MGIVGLTVSCNGNSLHQPLDDQSTTTGRKTSKLKTYVTGTSYSQITALMTQLLPLCPPQNTGGADMAKILLRFWERIFTNPWAIQVVGHCG